MPSVVWVVYVIYHYKKGKKEAKEGNFSKDIDNDKIEEYVEKYRKMASDSNELQNTTLGSKDVFNGHAAPVGDHVV